jgi:hypothetical protein
MLSTFAYLLIGLCPFSWGEDSRPDYKNLFDRIASLPEVLRENQQLPKRNQKVEQPKDLEMLLDYLEKCVKLRVPDSHAQTPQIFSQLEKSLLSARSEFDRDEELRKEIRNIVGNPSLNTEKAEKAFAEGKQIPSAARIALREAESKKSTYLLVLTNRIPFTLKDNSYLKGNNSSWAGMVSYLYACDQAVLQPRNRPGTRTH